MLSVTMVTLAYRECSFLSKAVTAMEAGAVGVLIADANHMNDRITFEMIQDGTGRETSIPTFSLTGRDGFVFETV